jgi:O-antigen ligase
MVRLAAQARRAALWIAVAIGVSLPISTALDTILVVALLACWIASGPYRDQWAALRANSFVRFPCFVFLLYVAGTTYSSAGAEEIVHALDKAAVILLIPVLIALRPTRELRERAELGFMAAMLLTLALSFLIWLGAVPGGGLLKGIEEDPTVFKMHITHGVLMAFAALMFASRARAALSSTWKIGLAVAAGLAAFNVLFMVHGRTGQVVLLVLAAYALIAWYRWRGVAMAAGLGAAMAATVYLAPSSALHERVQVTLAEIEDWRAGKPAQLRNLRLESWGNSVEIVRQHPLIGVGTGGFAGAYARQVEGTGMRVVGQPESQYLLTAVQLGLVGLAALVALFAGQWRLAARLETRADTELARGLVLTLAVGCLFNSFLLDHTEALFYAWLSGLLYAGLQPTPAGKA